MTLSTTHLISISVAFVGLLMVLESFIIINSRGVDVNGELPFMVFGTTFAAGMPAIVGIIGPWSKSWYWYLFIGFLIVSGFMSYIRSRGFTIRVFNGNVKTVQGGVEKILKQQYPKYQKESAQATDGQIVKYTLPDGKYPVQINEKKQGLMNDAYVEIVASEALWNKAFQLELLAFVNQARKRRTTGSVLKGVRPRLIVGVLTVFLGVFLYNM